MTKGVLADVLSAHVCRCGFVHRVEDQVLVEQESLEYLQLSCRMRDLSPTAPLFRNVIHLITARRCIDNRCKFRERETRLHEQSLEEHHGRPPFCPATYSLTCFGTFKFAANAL